MALVLETNVFYVKENSHKVSAHSVSDLGDSTNFKDQKTKQKNNNKKTKQPNKQTNKMTWKKSTFRFCGFSFEEKCVSHKESSHLWTAAETQEG